MSIKNFEVIFSRLEVLDDIQKTLKEISKTLNEHNTDVALLKKDVAQLDKDTQVCKKAVNNRIDKVERHIEKTIEPRLEAIFEKQQWLIGKISVINGIIITVVTVVANYFIK